MTTRRAFLLGTGLGLGSPSRSLAWSASPPHEGAGPGGPRLRPVGYRDVRVADSFWAPRQSTNRTATVPHLFAQMREQGYASNFERAARGLEGGYRGPVYMDSDLYKTLEAAACVLGSEGDPRIEAELDAMVGLVRAAQQPDGYLNTFYQVNRRARFTNLRDDHEIYCAGHLIEAGVAHFEATGQRTLLDPAVRYADLLDRTFGDGPGRRTGYCGHPEAELALFRLWRVTGERRYFELGRFFLEHRGEGFFAKEHPEAFVADFDGTYYQDHLRIRDHRIITGHAVRALYLLCAAADLAAETADPGLFEMMDRVWRNATGKRLFVTGGLGSSSLNEGFTSDYDLPNLSAYQESCASLAAALWAHRLALLHGDARYADLLEQSLYNAVAAGVSLDGRRFFYVNPLASDGTHHRKPWYRTACCPPNLARVLATLGGYAYAVSENDLYVNLYLQGQVAASLGAGRVRLAVETDYPWQGRVSFRVLEAPAAGVGLRLRVPGWCEGPVTLQVAGRTETAAPPERGYLFPRRRLRAGDRVELDLPMPVRRLEADPRVEEAAGRVALQRGPLVYCVEQADQDRPLATLVLPERAVVQAERAPEGLGGAIRLVAEALAFEPEAAEGALYGTAPFPRRSRSAVLTAVPYGLWDNRATGPMKVWIRAV